METSNAVSPGLSELEAKRQAVLASMQRKSQTKRPKIRPPSSTPSPVRSPDGPDNYGYPIDSDSVKSNLYNAVLDLRALGYSFDDIVEKSRVSRKFLTACYLEWKFIVPEKKVPIPVESFGTASAHESKVGINNSSINDQRSQSTTPVIYQRPLFNQRNRTPIDRPEWLDNLVIDLSETSEEESDDESSDEADAEEEDDSVTLKEGAVVDDQICDKKRKSTDEMIPTTNEKRELQEEINRLSNNIKKKEIKSNKSAPQLSKLMVDLKNKELQLGLLRKQVLQMENDITKVKDMVSLHNERSSQLSQFKSDLAEKLVQLDDLEKKEAKQAEIEKKRALLKQRLKHQLNLKREREAQELREKHLQAEKQQEVIVVDDEEDNAKKEQETAELASKADSTEYQDSTQDGMVSSNTIHKIPKVINISNTMR